MDVRPPERFDSGLMLPLGATASVAIGLSVIIGWHIGSSALVRGFASFEPMRYNAALGFVVSGAGLFLIWLERRVYGSFCAVAVAVIGASAAIEYIYGVDLGIDELFVKDVISSANPGRMAFSTATTFVLTGGSLFIMSRPVLSNPLVVATGLAGSIVASIGATAVIGFVSGISSVSVWGGLVAMALPTGVGFIFIGSAVTSFCWIGARDRSEGVGRRLPVVVALVAVLMLSMMLWMMAREQERGNIRRAVSTTASQAAFDIRDKMGLRVQAIERMARRWKANGHLTRADWESDAHLYIDHFDGYYAMAMVDDKVSVRWLSLRDRGGAASERALVTGIKKFLSQAPADRPGISPVLTLEGGSRVFMAYVPISKGGARDGFVLGVFDSQALFDSILLHEVGSGYSVSIYNDHETVYTRLSDGAVEKSVWALDGDVGIYGVDWTVSVWPSEDSIGEMRSALPWVVFYAGILLSAFVALSVYLGQKAYERARVTEAANLRLEAQVAERKKAEDEAERHARDLAWLNIDLEKEIAERKRAEDEAEMHARELARSNAELEQFAYVASHDLQEPLRVISGYVQLIARRYKGRLDESADEFIGFAVDGANRMQGLISDLLAYSRVGSAAREFGLTDCAAAMKSAMVNLRTAIEESGAVVTMSGLPKVLADGSQIVQLFQNLIGNAIKYKGPAPPVVHVGAARKGDDWVFSVKDNGIGMDPKYHDRIFVIFQRLHGKHEYSGTGIGLAICKKIVERHGGAIWVESALEKGCTFYFTIPAIRSDKA
ncbi:MAG: ATP-binding protein [Deltaproteobacteria bacterium]